MADPEIYGEGTLFDTSDRLPDRSTARPIGEEELLGDAPGFGEVFEASRTVQLGENFGGPARAELDGWAEVIEALDLPAHQNPALNWGQGTQAGNVRFHSSLAGGMVDRATQERLIVERMRALKKANPKAFAGLPDSPEALRQHWRDQAMTQRRAAQAVAGRGEGIGGMAANLAGSLAGSVEDPTFVPSLAIGGFGGGTIARIFVREALVNAGIEAIRQPGLKQIREGYGEQLTGGEAAANIILGGLFGGTLEAGGTALARGIGARIEQGRAMNAAEQAFDLFAEADDGQLAAAFREIVPEEAMTPDERAAVSVLERESEIGATSPFEASPEGDAQHAESLAAAINAISANRPSSPSVTDAAPQGGGRPSVATSTVAGGRVTQPSPARRSVPAGLPTDIVAGLKARGLPDHLARGVAAGIVAESRGSERIVNPTSGAYGLGQWLGPRKRELFRRYGPSPTREQQLDFLAWELKGGDHGGKAVLAAADEAAALRSYIVDFMRPAAGRETSGDLERGMAALGRGGERLEAGLASGEIEIDPAIARLRADSERLEAAIMAPAGPQAGPPMYRGTMRPGEILVDATRFQFKSGGDDAGVLDTLRGVDRWDPWSANPLILWEDNGGKRWLADGHQRHGLASRLEAQGQEIPLSVNIMREADGVSAEDARVYAALVNIRQGSGSAIDAAKVFKVAPEVLEAALPPQSALVRHARGLARLSDPAFGMVVNGHLAADHASAIGRLAPDNPELHEGLAQVLVDTDPSNSAQAEFIVRQAIADGFDTAEQITLFGESAVTTSLFKDKARVLEAAKSRLRKMKLVHKTAADNAGELEAAGSTIERDASKREAQANAEAIEIIDRLATRAGPIADALTAAATRLARGAKLGAAAGEFADAIRGLDLRALGREAGGDAGNGGSPDLLGRADDAGEASAGFFDEQPTLDELLTASERFSDPDGAAVKAQADSLVHDMRADIEGAPPVRAFRGIPQGVEDPFKVADRGPLGAGVYLSGQSSVAEQYGAEVIEALVGGRIFNGREMKTMDRAAIDGLLLHMTPEERARYDRFGPAERLYPDDLLERLTRSVEPERVGEIFKAEGYAGIEANRDGHEIVVFDPSGLSLARERIAAPEGSTFRMSEEGDEISAADLLKDLDDDEAAIKAMKDCL